jgi:site-specific DNA-cytosine methylase
MENVKNIYSKDKEILVSFVQMAMDKEGHRDMSAVLTALLEH